MLVFNHNPLIKNQTFVVGSHNWEREMTMWMREKEGKRGRRRRGKKFWNGSVENWEWFFRSLRIPLSIRWISNTYTHTSLLPISNRVLSCCVSYVHKGIRLLVIDVIKSKTSLKECNTYLWQFSQSDFVSLFEKKKVIMGKCLQRDLGDILTQSVNH